MPENPQGIESETLPAEEEPAVIDPENPSGVGDGEVVKTLTVEEGWVDEKIVHEEPDPETGVVAWHKEAGQ